VKQLAVTIIAALAALGCDSDASAGKDCTDIGCMDSLAVTVRAPRNVWPAGVYGFEFEFDGTVHACAKLKLPDALPSSPDVRSELECPPALSAAFDQQVICTETRTQNAISEACKPVAGQFKLAVSVSATPASFRARATRDDEVVLEATQTPEYEEERPNGPDCEPVCRQAQLELDLQ